MYTEAQESNNKLLQEKELFISGIYLKLCNISFPRISIKGRGVHQWYIMFGSINVVKQCFSA